MNKYVILLFVLLPFPAFIFFLTIASPSYADLSGCAEMDIGNPPANLKPPVQCQSAAGLVNPFPGGWIPNRLDAGYDGTFTGNIVAPFTGTITYAASSFSNWGGYIEIKAKQKPAGLPTSTLYFAEGVKPLVGPGPITAGKPIATGAHSPYGDAYKTNSNGIGEIEWGVAQDGTSVTDPYAYVASNPKQMVLDFATWAEHSFNLKPPTSTCNAGYAKTIC